MAAVTCVDLVLLVTEPTPFGWHDLLAALRMCRALGRPVAAVLNRSNLGTTPVRESLRRWRVPLLAEVPFSRQVAQANAQARMLAPTEDPFGRAISTIAEAWCSSELWAMVQHAFGEGNAHPPLPGFEPPELPRAGESP